MTYEQWLKEFEHASATYDALTKVSAYRLGNALPNPLDVREPCAGELYARVTLCDDAHGFGMFLHRLGFGPEADMGSLTIAEMSDLARLHLVVCQYIAGEISALPDVKEWND